MERHIPLFAADGGDYGDYDVTRQKEEEYDVIADVEGREGVVALEDLPVTPNMMPMIVST